MAEKRSVGVQILGLLGFLAATAAAGALGAWATTPEVGGWYARLRKPSWTPPGWLFGPVWTLLYALMAIAAWRVWRRPDAKPDARKTALACWAFQLALNVGWSWIFFRAHQTGFAFVELVSLWLAILATTVAFAGIDRPAAALMVPYLLWTTFAGVLNGTIHRMNP